MAPPSHQLSSSRTRSARMLSSLRSLGEDAKLEARSMEDHQGMTEPKAPKPVKTRRKTKRTYYTEAEKTELILSSQEFMDRGGSLYKWCKKHKVPHSTINYWRIMAAKALKPRETPKPKLVPPPKVAPLEGQRTVKDTPIQSLPMELDGIVQALKDKERYLTLLFTLRDEMKDVLRSLV